MSRFENMGVTRFNGGNVRNLKFQPKLRIVEWINE